MFRLSQSALRLSRASGSVLRPAAPTVRAGIQAQSLAERLARHKSDNPNPPISPFDPDREKKLAQQKLPSDPTKVTTTSTVRKVLEPSPAPQGTEPNISTSLKHDFDVIREIARFDEVPRESHVLGLLGTVPYLATSVSTLFLSWNLNKEWPTGNSFYDSILIDHDTARHLLGVIEPIQLGYGAIIISFLGAIHWGLEYAEKSPLRERTRFRYGMGLAASVIAWPTLMMPIEYALTTQFAAFVGMYFADSRAAKRGWAPHWYGTYRFLLTTMVGFAIFLSLVGRSKIEQGQAITNRGLTANITQSGIADNKTDWSKLEKVEKERRRKEKAERKRRELRKQKEEEGQAKSQGTGNNSTEEETSGVEDSSDNSDDSEEPHEKDEEQTQKKAARPQTDDKAKKDSEKSGGGKESSAEDSDSDGDKSGVPDKKPSQDKTNKDSINGHKGGKNVDEKAKTGKGGRS